MKIGIFDSGIGGLSLLHQARRHFPAADYIYYADGRHVPYGQRSREEIITYSREIIDFLLAQGAQAVVIACNTATSAAVTEMRARYSLPIIGMEPAVKKALDEQGGKVLVAATPVTIRGEKMLRLLERLDADKQVDLVALPELVRFAECCEFSSQAVTAYLRQELEPFRLEAYSSLVLGCTHFNYFKDSLRTLLPETIRLVDGIQGTVNRLADCVGPELQTGSGSVQYYDSGQLLSSQELERIEIYLRRLDEMAKIQ